MVSPVEDNGCRRIAEDVLVALRRIIRATDLHSRSLLRRFGLTGPQLVVLRQLGSGATRSGSELARAISLSLATTIGIVARLEARGLVGRERSTSDRRQKLISATEEGLRLLEAAPPPLQETFTTQLAALEEWEQTQMLAALQRIVAMMEATDLEASPILATGVIAEPGPTPLPGAVGNPEHHDDGPSDEPEDLAECVEE
jgi:DNA-binding MarR family transcriptional regulator